MMTMLGKTTTAAARAGAAAGADTAVRAMSTLTRATINPRVLDAQYAVRGELVIRADAMKKQMFQHPAGSGSAASPFPFQSVIHCNIGNPQELQQPPLTFIRQVLALCHYPELLRANSETRDAFPIDAIERAQAYLTHMPGGTGAYTNSVGVRVVRDEVARFIEERDGHPCDPESVFLTNGASGGVANTLNLLIGSPQDGVMTPIPQYPLYSATLSLLGGRCVGYFLDESTGWSLSEAELERSYAEARAKGTNVRALVVINPGNPTGQCLPLDVMQQVVRFCERNGLVLMADEVYQANVYADVPFTSFKKVVRDMRSSVELISYHSVSKGFLGECGQRGGYLELCNIDDGVRDELYKLQSISLCGNTSGQLTVGLMVNPPRPGQLSYALYEQERQAILDSLKRRAIKVASILNGCTGVSCQPVQGAMYAFPTITLPPKAVDAARAASKQPDTFYCLQLLESTGMCVVPGSGFGQRPGEYHFRTTILPSEAHLDTVMNRFRTFHEAFIKKYSA